jgi:chorismate mutase
MWGRERDYRDERERDQPPVDDMSLDELREEIRDVDRELVELILRRTNVAVAIASVKQAEGRQTTDEAQEQHVLDRARERANDYDMDPERVADVFEALIELSKHTQNAQR